MGKTFVLFTLLVAFPISNVWQLAGLKYSLFPLREFAENWVFNSILSEHSLEDCELFMLSCSQLRPRSRHPQEVQTG